MSDAFGKIIGFLLASVLLFIVPLTFYAGRQQNLSQLCIINESIQLVESVKNTGVITEDMYRGFETNVFKLGGNYKIELSRTHYEYNLNKNGDYVRCEETYYTPQLMEELGASGRVEFAEEDYVYIRVSRMGKGLMEKISSCFLNYALPENETLAYYGGYVKNEDY